MVVWSKKYFNEKIDSFSEHSGYGKLRAQADEILRNFDGPAWASIAAMDFMDRIIAMPEDYIRDWLDGKNELEWRPKDEAMLMAIKCGYVDVLEAFPNADIRVISESSAKFYEDYGYEIVRKSFSGVQGNAGGFAPRVFAVKNKGVEAIIADAKDKSNNDGSLQESYGRSIEL